MPVGTSSFLGEPTFGEQLHAVVGVGGISPSCCGLDLYTGRKFAMILLRNGRGGSPTSYVASVWAPPQSPRCPNAWSRQVTSTTVAVSTTECPCPSYRTSVVRCWKEHRPPAPA
jgi:hypothetical protein